MSGKALLRAVLLCVGITGFVMVSLGIVLLVLQYPMTFMTIGLIVLGTGHLVALCCPDQEKRLLLNMSLLNLAKIFLILSGLLCCMQAEGTLRAAGLVCVFVGLLIDAACSLFLAIGFLSGTGSEKSEKKGQNFDDRLFDNYLDALIQAKLLKHKDKIRKD